MQTVKTVNTMSYKLHYCFWHSMYISVLTWKKYWISCYIVQDALHCNGIQVVLLFKFLDVISGWIPCSDCAILILIDIQTYWFLVLKCKIGKCVDKTMSRFSYKVQIFHWDINQIYHVKNIHFELCQTSFNVFAQWIALKSNKLI